MANPTLTFTQNAVTYTTNETPMAGKIGLAVTVANSLTQSVQYKLDDVDPASALTEGDLGAVGTTTSFMPDVIGAYMIGAYDPASGARVAQLAFCVPDWNGDVQPPHNATSDEADPLTGVVTFGNFRPNGVAWAKYKTKGWKTVVKTLRSGAKGGSLPVDLTAGDVHLTAADLDGIDTIIAFGTAGVSHAIYIDAPYVRIAGRKFACVNNSDDSADFLAGGGGLTLPIGVSGTVAFDDASGQFQPTSTYAVITGGSSGPGLVMPDHNPDHFLDGNGSWSSTRWRTACDVSFKTAGSVNLSADGAHTIAGLSFVKENSTNDAFAMASTNGTGLEITPTSVTYYGGANRSSPLLWLRLDEILPSTVDWSTGIRIYAYMPTLTNATGDYDRAIVGIDTDSTALMAAVIRGANTGAPTRVVSGMHTLNNTLVGVDTAVAALDASNSCVMLELDSLVPLQMRAYYGTGSSGTPFPAMSALQIAAASKIGNAATAGYAGSTIDGTTKNPRTALGVTLTAARGGSAHNLYAVIERLRVDYCLK